MGITPFLGPLQGLINLFQSERHYRDDKKDAALSAINNALIETKRYLEESGGANCAERTREFKLSELWAEAAVKSRHASGELALRLGDKSLYWSDNLKWSREEVLAKDVDLDSIQAQVRELMKG